MTSSPVAIDIAPGKTSFEDCDMLTWSLGWIGFLEPSSPPSSSMARFEMTSLAFMLDWVPEPVCQTTSGKWSSRSPSITSWAAERMASATSPSSLPSASFTVAEACLTMPSARMIERGIRSSPILKFSSERCVCAPQYLSSATSMAPMLSVSVRVVVIVIVLPRRGGAVRVGEGSGVGGCGQ